MAKAYLDFSIGLIHLNRMVIRLTRIHTILILILLMGPMILPLIQLTPVSGKSLNTITSAPVVDSMLAMELKALRSNDGLAGEQSTRAILRFTSELTQAQLESVEALGVKLVYRDTRPVHVGAIYLADVFDISSLNSLTELGLVYASAGDKQFYPSITTSVPATKAPDVRENLSKDGVPIDGTGTMVAVLDTGVEWLHPAFWRVTSDPLDVIDKSGKYYADIDDDGIADSNEGPIAVVNQQSPSTIEVSNEYMYIDVNDDGNFDFAEGDRWLAGVDGNDDGIISLPSEQVVVLGESKVAILYDQYTGNVYVRGVNLTTSALSVGDDHGHGTHVTSIIAGGQPGYTDMVGVAPGADILAIRSTLLSSDIIDAISFSAENDADVINMSFSSFLGFLDGTDVEDVAVNEAMRSYDLIASLAAGNLGASQKHAYFSVPAGKDESATLSVSNPPDYSFLNILWYSADDDESVTLISPNGEVIEFDAFGEITGKSFEIKADDLKAYAFADTSIRGTNRLIIQISASDHEWANGEWSVKLSNPSGSKVEVNCYAWAGSWSDIYLKFTSHVDVTRTLSSPGTADLGVTVGSCADSFAYVSGSSGRGPRIDGARKPEVAAPGIGITAALNSLTSLWTVRSGTSMAAPHVAGVLALVSQASSTKSSWDVYSAVVQGAGGFTRHNSDPLPDWGYGPVDALTAVRYVFPLEYDDSPSITDWAGVPRTFGPDEEGSLPEALDLVDIKIFPTSSSLSLAVSLRGSPDFTGNSTLSISWDTDNNPSTGDSGAEVLISYNDGSVDMKEWTGSYYVESPVQIVANESSNSVLFNIETGCSVPDRFRVSTTNNSNYVIDDTDWFTLSDTWLPVIRDVGITRTGAEWTFDVFPSDVDTPLASINYTWSVVNGGLEPLDSGSSFAKDHITVVVDTSSLTVSESLCIWFNLTYGITSFYAPLILLAGDLSTQVEILSAELDSHTIPIGFLISGAITGKITVSGVLFIDKVELALHSSAGYWLNFTLSGDNGTYPIFISADSMAAGEYDVYAVVVDKNGVSIEQAMGVLYIVNDYSRVVLISVVLVAVIVIINVYKMRTPP